MSNINVPLGWTREVNERGKIVYTSPPPKTKIHCFKKLQEYQDAGRFKDVDAASFNFHKNVKNEYEVYQDTSYSASLEQAPLQQECISGQSPISGSDMGPPKKIQKIQFEKNKTNVALEQLTKDSSVESINHKDALNDCCKRLQRARVSRLDRNSAVQDINLGKLRSDILQCDTDEKILNVLLSNSGLRDHLANVEQNVCYEQMVTLGRSTSYNPLRAFPPDINSNIYVDIVDFGLEKVPSLIRMLVDFVVDREKMVTEDNVIKIASLFSQFAYVLSRSNDALVKVKTLEMKEGGVSHEALDELSKTGIATSSRSFNRQKDYFAAISDDFVEQAASSSPHQLTTDNLDIVINGVANHLMLAYLEFEQINTKHMIKEGLTFDRMVEAFSLDNILLTSPGNEQRLEHLKTVVAITLGRLFSDNIPGVSWMKSVLPNHYSHPNSNSTKKPAILYTKKPLYLSEQVNSEMIELCEREQVSFLQLVGASLPPEERLQYSEDLCIIQAEECDVDVREAAEARVHEAVLVAGEWIGHGDLLTMERFYVAKRLRQGSVTAFERLEFLRFFRLELFHLKMNKVIQDYDAGMKNEVNVDDPLTLGYFKAFTGMKTITKDPKVIKSPGKFEEHDQNYSNLGAQFLIDGFKHFLLHTPELPQSKDFDSARDLVLNFLEKYDIKYFVDDKNTEEKEPYDDLLTYTKDISSRTVHSLVMDKLEEESDSLGLEAYRRTMICYTLARKENIQDSKYASWLLFDLVMELSASPRTKARMDHLVTCNPTGLPGAAVFRDKRNEHEVRLVKTSLRGIHGSLNDVGVEKTICGLNVASKITDHDKNSMLLPKKDHSSYDYIGAERRDIINEEIRKADIFSKTRQKVSFFDKTTASVYTNMSCAKLERFVRRNQKNFKRNFTDRKI